LKESGRLSITTPCFITKIFKSRCKVARKVMSKEDEDQGISLKDFGQVCQNSTKYGELILTHKLIFSR
jgi:hypothetical protein